MERIIYELKYCERCGSLCTRRSDSSDTYCDACTQIMTHVCLPVGAVGRLRFGRNRKLAIVPRELKAETQTACGRLQ
jgi:hypothetical protein